MASPLAAPHDPLELDPHWPSPLPLMPLAEALAAAVFQDGLSRDAWLRRLAGQLNRPALLPLLWLLPRGWRLAPAQLPPQLQRLAGLLEEGLLSPALLAALMDDLPHLLPAAAATPATDPLALWSRAALTDPNGEQALPQSLDALQSLLEAALQAPEDQAPTTSQTSDQRARREGLSGALQWRNSGLPYAQKAACRRLNSLVAQLLNRLAANQHSLEDPWCFEATCSGRDWLQLLVERGWRLEGRLRSSVASFGLGASLRAANGGWRQVPLGLPLRTGLLEPDGSEAMALLPHTALELSLQDGRGSQVLLQYYQGSEGLCGWEGLNDLQRPWQNDRGNGTVRYLGEPMAGERLLELIDLSEWMALVHNITASRLGLRFGGYGTLGFCIDTTALLQQAIEGSCQLFPLLLSGIWRERLLLQTQGLRPRSERARQRYHDALQQLPLDLSHHGGSRADAWRRLQSCQPLSSPFALVRQCREPRGTTS